MDPPLGGRLEIGMTRHLLRNRLPYQLRPIQPSIPRLEVALDGLVETFVCGAARAHLVRKIGFGMDPPFRRMRPPRSAVVEMRTEATRTFGFFVCSGVFVAHQLDLSANTHADESLYDHYGDKVLTLLNRVGDQYKDETSDVEDLIGSGGDGK